MRRVLLIAAFAGIMGYQWGTFATAAPPLALSELLWLPPNATQEPTWEPGAFKIRGLEEGRTVYLNGSADLSFVIKGPIDRRDLEALGAQLAAHVAGLPGRWKPRGYTWENPGRERTSFKSGWAQRCACTVYDDEQGKPVLGNEDFEWVGEWDGSRGARLSYRVMGYLNAERPRDARYNNARGYASYSPAAGRP